jgi:ABC-2 type transport system permease protein
MRNVRLKNVWLVAKREYLERVKTKAFIILTVLTPVLIAGFGIGPSALMMRKTKGERRITIVSANNDLVAAIKKNLEQGEDPADSIDNKSGAAKEEDGLRFFVNTSSDLSEASRQDLQVQIDRKQIHGFVWLDEKSIADHKFQYTAANTADFQENDRIRRAVRDAAMKQELKQNGDSEGRLDAVLKPFDMDEVQWSQGKAKKGGGLQFFSVFILGFAMYMITLMYGMNVLRAVITEKTSRIMEVLLSTLTPAELMSGKIFGVAAVGITQVAIWILAGALLSAPGAYTLGALIQQANLTLATGLFFAVYFLLGFLLYSSMCAGLGATVNSEQEAQQFQFFVIMPLMLSFFYMFVAMKDPNGPLTVALSIFPFSAPIVMYTRLIIGSVPVWQVALSIVLMIAAIIGVIWLCARIYRVGVLMYGKKPNLPEIIRWIKYA